MKLRRRRAAAGAGRASAWSRCWRPGRAPSAGAAPSGACWSSTRPTAPSARSGGRAGSETGFTLGRILAPLEPWRSKLLVLGGVNMALADAGFGSHHTRGIGGLLTGRPILMGNFQSAGPPTAGWASGISIDQHIARTRRRHHPLPHAGAGRAGDRRRGARPHLVPGRQPAGAADGEPLRRRSIGCSPAAAQPGRPAPGQPPGLDPARNGCGRSAGACSTSWGRSWRPVRGPVGADDRAAPRRPPRVGARHRAPAGAGRWRAARARPRPPAARPRRPAPRMDVQPPARTCRRVGKLQMDLLAAALACDLTRVVTLQWTHAESNQTFPLHRRHRPAPRHVPRRRHRRRRPGEPDQDQRLVRRAAAYLLDKLASYREGDAHAAGQHRGALGERGRQGQQPRPPRPALPAGRQRRRPLPHRPLRRLSWPTAAGGHPHNNLLVSLANAMGLPDTTFGDPAHCTGPLPGLG